MKLRIVLKVKIAPNRFLQFYAPSTYSSLIEVLAQHEDSRRKSRLWYSSGDGNLVLLTSEMYPFVISTWPFAQLILVSEPFVPKKKVNFLEIKTKVFQRFLAIYSLMVTFGYRIREWGKEKKTEIKNQCVSAFSHIKKSALFLRSYFSRNSQSWIPRFSVGSMRKRGLRLGKRLGFVPLTVLVLLLSYIGLGSPPPTLSTLRVQYLSSKADFALGLALASRPELISADFATMEIPDSDVGKVFYGNKGTKTGFLFHKGLSRVEYGTFGPENKLNGQGIRIERNGEMSQGGFSDGFRHGEVSVLDPFRNIVYSGRFQNGEKYGFGKEITYQALSQIDFSKPEQFLWGVWTDSLYIGQWVSDAYGGKGQLQTANFTYIGDFNKGTISGQGIMKKNNVSLYGSFDLGLLDGFGCEETQEIFVCGQFQEGKCNGKVLKSNKKTGEVSSVTCANGKERANWW